MHDGIAGFVLGSNWRPVLNPTIGSGRPNHRVTAISPFAQTASGVAHVRPTVFPSAITSARRGGLAKALAKVGRAESRFLEQSRKRSVSTNPTQSMETSSLSVAIQGQRARGGKFDRGAKQ